MPIHVPISDDSSVDTPTSNTVGQMRVEITDHTGCVNVVEMPRLWWSSSWLHVVDELAPERLVVAELVAQVRLGPGVQVPVAHQRLDRVGRQHVEQEEVEHKRP